MAELALQVKDLGDHCLALGWRLDLQEQTLGLRLSAVSPWECPQQGARRALGAPQPAVRVSGPGLPEARGEGPGGPWAPRGPRWGRPCSVAVEAALLRSRQHSAAPL